MADNNDINNTLQGWWKEKNDIKGKKLRRAKHREKNPNLNKKNKIMLTKGKNKRFYTKPVMSWGQLISKDTNYDNDGDQIIDDNELSDDGIIDFDPNNTNFDKFNQFDYGEINDTKNNEIETEQKQTVLNNDKQEEQDIECNENEETEQNEEFELWDIEQFENDIEQNNELKTDYKNENKFDIFDDNGNCILEINENDTSFYRNEENEDQMWEYWMELRHEFRYHVKKHKMWLERREERKFDDLMNKALIDEENDDNGDGDKHDNRPKKRRRVDD